MEVPPLQVPKAPQHERWVFGLFSDSLGLLWVGTEETDQHFSSAKVFDTSRGIKHQALPWKTACQLLRQMRISKLFDVVLGPVYSAQTDLLLFELELITLRPTVQSCIGWI